MIHTQRSCNNGIFAAILEPFVVSNVGNSDAAVYTVDLAIPGDTEAEKNDVKHDEELPNSFKNRFGLVE